LLKELSPTATNKEAVQTISAQKASSPVSPEEALEILRNEPSYESLVSVVRWLTRERSKQGAFNVGRPSPAGSQIIQVLVTDIAPSYWDVLREDASEESHGKKSTTLQLLLGCLRNIPGINAALLRLRALTHEAKTEKKDVRRPDLIINLRITLELLKGILDGTDAVERIWRASNFGTDNPSQRRPLEQEFVTLLGSGRLVSWPAEADEALRLNSNTKRGCDSCWMSDGTEYARWVGRNVASWIARSPSPEDARLCSQLLARSLRLGYTGMYAFQTFLPHD
jgi:telomere length regulation protein